MIVDLPFKRLAINVQTPYGRNITAVFPMGER